jgi:4-diphosphocytidyl-2-C-methyl-D-erythritol kinase
VLTEARTTAFAKVNLCLFVGPTRDDGRHALVTLFESAGPDDDLVITPLASGPDEVVCPGVAADNLVGSALAALRECGWDAPPLRVEVTKRIPVAAGLGGGSADAAALLRQAERIAPVASSDVETIARRLGADVPSQLVPGPSIGTGAGEIIELAPSLEDHTLLILPQPFGLSTAAVYREADRLGVPRTAAELAAITADLQECVRAQERTPAALPSRLMANDLEAAALSLRPEIGEALEAATAAGADHALVCGSGPTVIGIFWGAHGFPRVQDAAEGLRDRYPGVVAAGVVERGVPAPAPNE